MKMLLALIAILFTYALPIYAGNDDIIKVACVGDSITYGSGIKDRTQTYPAQLQKMLGDKYKVENFGRGGTTLLKKARAPYVDVKEYRESKEFQPDIVIIMLGTNDTRVKNWAHAGDFKKDYTDLIKTFRKLKSKPKVWICYPVPVFGEAWGINNKTLKGAVIPLIGEVAKETKVELIDLYKPLDGKPKLVPDKVHPREKGAKIMAKTVFKAITKK